MTSRVHLRKYWPNCYCTPSKSSSEWSCGTGENVRRPNQPMSLHRFQRHGGLSPFKMCLVILQVLICEIPELAPLLGIGWWHLLWLRSVRHIVEFRNVPFEAICVLEQIFTFPLYNAVFRGIYLRYFDIFDSRACSWTRQLCTVAGYGYEFRNSTHTRECSLWKPSSSRRPVVSMMS